MPFVEVPFTTTADQMAVDAIARLQDRWDGWEPNDGDLEVIQIETIAPMTQDAIEVAASVPEAIFRNYGTQLVGEAYRPGQPAVGSATFTAIDSDGHETPDIVQLGVSGWSFSTDAPLVIAAGQTSATQTITAVENGVAYNGVSGSADPISAVPWLDTIVVSNTAGGIDSETDAAYRDRLADFLRLQSTTLVTGEDYVLMALQQPGIGRATAIVGQARKVTVTVTDEQGEPVQQQIKDDLAALYDDYRQVNTLHEIVDPTYTTIDVAFELVALPGYDLVDVHDRAADAVTSWLSPANWGRPIGRISEENSSVWLPDECVVRYAELIRVLSLDGVRYVDTDGTTLNGAKVDVHLPEPPSNPVPLTRPGSIDGIVNASPEDLT